MRIAIPVTCLARGGGIRFLVEIGNGLSARGHDICFLSLAGQPVEYSVNGRLVQIPRLSAELMPEADLVLPNFYMTVAAALSGRAMPVRICLGYEPLFVEQAAEAAATYRIPMPIGTISLWLQRILVEKAGRHSVVINPGVDHGIFYPVRTDRQPATVVCLARKQEHGAYWFKGFPQFVQAMLMVHARFRTVRTAIVSPDLQVLNIPFPATLVAAPGDREFADLLRQATVFVFPSLLEGFGLPPLEAMACGTPVVTTDCGGVSDYARHELNSLVAPPGNVAALAEAIMRLLADPQLRFRLSEAAVETARPWTWARTVAQVEIFLEQVLRGEFVV